MSEQTISNDVIETLVTEVATVRKLFGIALETAHEVPFEFSELAPNSALPADEALTHEEIIGVLNARRKAASRAVATNKLAESLGMSKPKLLDTDEGRIAHFVKGFKAMGMSDADALALAKSAVSAATK